METSKTKKVHIPTVSFDLLPQFNFTRTREVYLSLADLQGIALITPLHTFIVTAPETEN